MRSFPARDRASAAISISGSDKVRPLRAYSNRSCPAWRATARVATYQLNRQTNCSTFAMPAGLMPENVLKNEDYPEFRDEADAWARKMRDQDLHLERGKGRAL